MLFRIMAVNCAAVIQDSEGQGCPFCRCEIKGTEQVVVDPFDERPQLKSESRPLHSPHIDNDDDEPVSHGCTLSLLGKPFPGWMGPNSVGGI